MAGRPKKKPEYNPELQFNNFLQELRDAYEEAASLRSLADELNISLLKLRKLLITADVFTSDICTEINNLHQSGKKISEIMKLTGLSRASVHSYLPYTKGLYNASNITDFEEVVKLDTQYIGEWSVKGDISILFKTVIGVLKNDGAV